MRHEFNQVSGITLDAMGDAALIGDLTQFITDGAGNVRANGVWGGGLVYRSNGAGANQSCEFGLPPDQAAAGSSGSRLLLLQCAGVNTGYAVYLSDANNTLRRAGTFVNSYTQLSGVSISTSYNVAKLTLVGGVLTLYINGQVAFTYTDSTPLTGGFPGFGAGGNGVAPTPPIDYFDDLLAVLPTITAHPASITVGATSTTTFSVTVGGGSTPMTYQWQKNTGGWVAISGATSVSYTTPALVAGDTGGQYRVVITNSAGSVNSNAATLTVTAAPTSAPNFIKVVGGYPVGTFGSTVGAFAKVLRRALTIINGVKRQLQTAQLGTGLKPLVLLNGMLKLRSTTEGIPVVFANGQYRTLASSETLEL
jgi:hypothetical protein